MNIRSKLAGAERPPFVVAFDGDDTLWVDTTAEQDWERHFTHLAIDRLPDPQMAKLFRGYLDLYGFTLEGIRQALLRAGAETCPRELPDAWQEQVKALPGLASTVPLRSKPGVERLLASAKGTSTQLWLITKGDLIRQAIKIARFGYAGAFAHVEIVPKKTQATYRAIFKARAINPERFMMIGDSFTQDVLPVLRLGGRAVHVPAGRWATLRPFEIAFQSRRFTVCSTVMEAQQVCGF